MRDWGPKGAFCLDRSHVLGSEFICGSLEDEVAWNFQKSAGLFSDEI